MNLQWIFLLTCALFGICSGEFKRVCYVEGWARYRPINDRFNPENVDVHLCTHILYAFATLDASGTRVKATDNDDDPEMYKRFTGLKSRNPNLKTMISVGGWSMGSDLFHKAVATDASRKAAAQNIVQFLRSHNFDGVDIDWEYPAARGSPPSDKHRFTLYIAEIRAAFDQESKSSGKPALILSAALDPVPSVMQDSYEVLEVIRYFDFINLMLYDMHGTWESEARHHAALYSSKTDTNSVDHLATLWMSMGVPKSKIIIGVPFYGRTFNLADPNHSNVGDKITGPGGAGALLGDTATLSYQEICLLIKKGAVVKRLPDQRVPYMVDNNRWTGYDDEISIAEKMKYIVKHGFGGAMVWSIDQDDFNGMCGGEKYPLLKSMYRILGGRIIG